MGINHQKRKRGHSPILHRSVEKDVQIDKAYASYLHKLGLSEPDIVVESEDDDHTYMSFLANLKPYGNSYMLAVSIKNGLYSPIWYEVDNDPLNETTPGSYGIGSMREVETIDVDTQSDQERSASLEETTQGDALIKKRKRAAFSQEVNVGRKDSLVEENVLRRSPRFLETSSKAQEEPNVHDDLLSEEDIQNPTLVRERRIPGADGKLHLSCRNSPSGTGNENALRECPNVMQEKSRLSEIHQEVGYQQPSEQDCMPSSRAGIVDKVYRTFISGLKVVGDSVFYEYGDGKRVYYEGNDEPRQNNAEGEPLDNALIPQIMTPRPQTPSPRRPTPPTLLSLPTTTQTPKEDSHGLRTSAVVRQSSKTPSSDFSSFWKALEKDLRRPFERKEYENLLEEVSARKPIKVHRESRSGGHDYAPEDSKLGNSYLDSYPDLKDEIEKAESDPYKVINLLRGFFIFLQKTPHGVPKPWKDDYFKAIMPGTKYGCTS